MGDVTEIPFNEPQELDSCAPFEPPPAAPLGDDGSVSLVAVLAGGAVVDPEQPFDLPGADAWVSLATRYPGLVARSHFEGRSREQIEGVEGRAREVDPFRELPSLLSLVEVTVPGCLVAAGVDIETVIEDLRELAVVEEVHLAEMPAAPPQVGLVTTSLMMDQVHLGPAPTGVDAVAAWGVAGGFGDGIEIVDVEWGWGRVHPDLPAIPHRAGTEVGEYSHGTSVAGLLVARDDAKGVVGMVHRARLSTVSSWSGSPARWRPAVAIADACEALKKSPGSVLLLEEQVTSPRRPLEFDYASRLAITKAAMGGVVVIEPAGNGGLNLDQWPFAGKYFLRRGHGDFTDSGSIMVGACTPRYPQAAVSSSNYGSRVDCFAQGLGVVTTDIAPRYYTKLFSGTSSASAIIAGAAAIVQACLKEARPKGTPLTSRQMRWVLSTHGTASDGVKPTGRMPDLKQIVGSRAWEQIPNPIVYN